jgi:hypothetical protein
MPVECICEEPKDGQTLETPVNLTLATGDANDVIDPPGSFLLYVDNESLNSFLINQIIAPADFFEPGEVPSHSILRVAGASLLLIPSSHPLRSTELRQYANDSGSSYVVAVELPLSAVADMRGRALKKGETLSEPQSPAQMLRTDIAFVCDPWCSVSFPESRRVLFQETEHKGAVPLISPNLSFDPNQGSVNSTAFRGDNELTLSVLRERLGALANSTDSMTSMTKKELEVLPRIRGFLLAAVATSGMALKSSGRVKLDRAILEVIAASIGRPANEGTKAWEKFRIAALQRFNISSKSTSPDDFDSQDASPFRTAGSVLSMLGHKPQDPPKPEKRRTTHGHGDDAAEIALATTMRYLATNSPAVLDDRATFWALLKEAFAALPRTEGTNQGAGAETAITSYYEGLEYLQQVQSGRAKMNAERLISLSVLRALWPVAGSPTINEFEAKLGSLRLSPGENRLAWSFFGLLHGFGRLPARFKERDNILLVDRILHEMMGDLVLASALAKTSGDYSESLGTPGSQDTTFRYQASSGLLNDLGIQLRVQDYDSRSSMLKALASAEYDQRLQEILAQRILPPDLRGLLARGKEPLEIHVPACKEFSAAANSDRTVVTLPQMPLSIEIVLRDVRAVYSTRRPHDEPGVIVANGNLSFNKKLALLELLDVRSMTGSEGYELTERIVWTDWDAYKTGLLTSLDGWHTHGLTDEDLRSLVPTPSTDPVLPASRKPGPPAPLPPARTQKVT